MHKQLAQFVVAVLVVSLGSGPAWAEEPSPAATRIQADIEYLAGDAMDGRGIGTAGLDRAADFIAEQFAELGLKTDLIDGGPFQTFMSTTRVPKVARGMDWSAVDKAQRGQPEETTEPDDAADATEDDAKDEVDEAPKPGSRRPVEVKNVLALLPGEGPRADEIIVVGAHYDHLGVRQKTGDGAVVFNGANDNASGTAALLEIARALAQREEKLPRSVLFIAFSAEERGLVGSFYYVKHPVLPLKKTVAMVNLDMVGCLQEDVLMAIGAGTSKLMTRLVGRLFKDHGLTMLELPSAIAGSDHVPFYSHEVPVVMLATTGGRQHYHRPSDDSDTLDFAGTAKVAALATDLVVALAESEKRPKFQDSGWGGVVFRNLFRFMGAAASAGAEKE